EAPRRSYRTQFASADKVIEYETEQYGARSYGDVLWQVEQELLSRLTTEFRRNHDSVDYLDFAAGTGRIISFMEGLVDTAVGIEVSELMAERARQKVKSARILCADITQSDAPVEGTYDLITAF